MTSITGETGAGKSILIGGLALVLGKRADLTALKDSSKKCFVDATFSIRNYGLDAFFSSNDLDYSPITTIRREIVPSGKSRAFINDTPVNLSVLQALGDRLIDVHSQHQTLSLIQEEYQMEVLDALADNTACLQEYQDRLTAFKALQSELNLLSQKKETLFQERDYNQFLLDELSSITFRPNLLVELEEESQALSNVEDLQKNLGQVHLQYIDEQMGVQAQLNTMRAALHKTAGLGAVYKNLNDRFESIVIEMNDFAQELERLNEQVEANPARLEEVGSILHQLQQLMQKHQVHTLEELEQKQRVLSQKVLDTEQLDNHLNEVANKLSKEEKQLEILASQLHQGRMKAIPVFQHKLLEILMHLGMPNARFQLDLEPSSTFMAQGKERLSFGFSANQGSSFGPLKKVASGGELSRIMLGIKAILSAYKTLPTIIFDEIDTGVSGEVGNKIAEIMQHMGSYMQVITITHLPQVAAKAQHHFKVYKSNVDGDTFSQVKKLTQDQRTQEIAQMLSGDAKTDTAIRHAKELLN